MSSDSDSDSDSEIFEDPYWDLDKKTRLRIVKSYALRLNEMPDPDLSPAQLEQILEWEMIPSNATHMYEYAMFVNGFRRNLNQLDPSKLDARTLRLAMSTLEKIGYGEPEGFRYNELLAGMGGITSIYLLYYCVAGSSWSFLGSFIPILLTASSNLTVSRAKDRHGLKQGYQEMKAYQDAVWQSAKLIFMSEVGFPTLACMWRWMKRHPWWGGVVVLTLPVVYGFLTNPAVQECWNIFLQIVRFRWAWFNGWMQFSQRYALDTVDEYSRIVIHTLRSGTVVSWLPRAGCSEAEADEEGRFVYATGFQHDKRIRLLRIKRRIPFVGMEAELIEADLKSNPPPLYEAISHVWSHGESDHTILLHGVPFPITSSDYSILDKSSSYLAPKTVWIDTICINQNDNVEKVSQIKKMRNIYYKASKVQVHLVDAPSSWFAIPFLHELLQAYGASKSDCSAIMTDMMARTKDDKWLRARIDSIIELFANEWFERAWVIQEFVSAREVVVNYGRHSLDWSKFAMLAQMIADEDIPEVAQCLMSGGNQAGARLKSWVRRPVRFEDWRGRLLSKRLHDFRAILITFQSCKATKWQDKIFALIGFSESAKRLSGLIDYDLPKDELLLSIAHHIIGHENLMDTFPFAGLSLLPSQPSNLPSWVADWTASRDIDHIVAGHNRKYAASPEEYAFISTGVSCREILVSGVLFDAVKDVSIVDLDFHPDAGTLQSNPQLIDKVVAYFTSAMSLAQLHCSNPYRPFRGTPTPLYEAVSRTLIGDAIKLRQPMMWNYHNIVSRFLLHAPLLKQILIDGAVLPDTTHPDHLSHAGYQPDSIREFHVHAPYETEPDFADQIHHLQRDLERARWLCGGRDTRRWFGVTDKGYMGMLPRTTKAGDVVCIVKGAKVPMVLRKMPSVDAYQLVGEAYVHGIMEGEGLQGGVETRFRLR